MLSVGCQRTVDLTMLQDTRKPTKNLTSKRKRLDTSSTQLALVSHKDKRLTEEQPRGMDMKIQSQLLDVLRNQSLKINQTSIELNEMIRHKMLIIGYLVQEVNNNVVSVHKRVTGSERVSSSIHALEGVHKPYFDNGQQISSNIDKTADIISIPLDSLELTVLDCVYVTISDGHDIEQVNGKATIDVYARVINNSQLPVFNVYLSLALIPVNCVNKEIIGGGKQSSIGTHTHLVQSFDIY